jgi:type II secretory pathway component PulC
MKKDKEYRYCGYYIRKNIKVFFTVLELMPDIFTSVSFAFELRKNGVPEKITSQGAAQSFLTRHAKKVSVKTWQKISSQNDFVTGRMARSPLSGFSDSELIAEVKLRGMVVGKTETRFVEL